MEPTIEKRWTENGEEHTETVWNGTFYADPSSHDEEWLREELAEAAKQHRLEPDPFEPDHWERELKEN